MPPFLTELDPRGRIKGSRDPLGIQPLWSRLGRQVVGNLTTVSNSVRDFSVLLLGHYLIERVREVNDGADPLTTFLKWEQIAAYARFVVLKDSAFRGTERVARRVSEQRRVSLGTDDDAQILGSQKTYGLWGLYSVPARSSGLLEGDPVRLTEAARSFVIEHYVPMLNHDMPRMVDRIVDRLRDPSAALNPHASEGEDARMLKVVARVLERVRPSEQVFLRQALIEGGLNTPQERRAVRDRQALLASLLAGTLHTGPREDDWVLIPSAIQQLADWASQRDEAGCGLSHHLMRIRAAESVLAPADALFEYLLDQDRQDIRAVAERVQEHWGRAPAVTVDIELWRTLESALRTATDDLEGGTRWLRFGELLVSGAYVDAIVSLVQHNAAIMQSRSAAAAWITIDAGKLHVRFKDQAAGRLPDQTELPNYWRHAYFIGALRDVTRALQ